MTGKQQDDRILNAAQQTRQSKRTLAKMMAEYGEDDAQLLGFLLQWLTCEINDVQDILRSLGATDPSRYSFDYLHQLGHEMASKHVRPPQGVQGRLSRVRWYSVQRHAAL